MSDAEHATSQPLRGVRAIEVRVAAALENLSTVRTLIGAIGTSEDLDFDTVSDLRLAVDEACTRLIRSAAPGATLEIVIDPRDDEVVIDASTSCDTAEMTDVITPGSFSWHVLSSLTDDVQTFHNGSDAHADGRVCGISMTTRRVSSAR